jgi:[ribosomal protein S5]-alanine N-acetyltransferase
MVEIVTKRLVLRPVRADDAETLAHLSSDFDIARMTVRIPFPNPVAGVRAWMQSSIASGEHAFVPTIAGNIIGVVSYFPPPHATQGELGYWVSKPHWGKGYATEMVRGLIRHAFLSPDLHEVPIEHFSDNPASGRVIAKCGFKPVGQRTLHSLARGQDVLSLTYRLTRADAEAQPWYAAP